MNTVAIDAAQRRRERIRKLNERVWIGYTRALEIREALEELMHYPPTHRMPNVAVIGDTNNGKTMLLEHFFRRHGPPRDPNAEKLELPVFFMELPPEVDERRLYSAMLEKLFAGGTYKEGVDSKLFRLKTILFRLDTRMIVLDEFQHALAADAKKQRRFLNAVKHLGNELRIPIVAAGTPEALNALQSDPQIANRFQPHFLPKWERGEEFYRLLATLEPTLGLERPSGLHKPSLADRVLEASGGTIGEIVDVTRKAAAHAIRTGEERITAAMLTPSALRKLGYTHPAKRNRTRPR